MQQLIDLRNETPEAISLQAIGAFMEVGRPAVVLFSGGKDSSVLLNLALTAAVEQARQGRNPMVVIAHSDVGVENPEIQRLVSGEIAKAARRPEAVVGMHYFSPVHKMPLLEIIPSAATAPEVIATAVALGKKQGKTVIRVGDAPGFYVNRILGPYMAEGAWLLTEGATIEDLDAALTGYGFPVGPIALLDEVGIDVGEKVGKILQAGFGDRMKAPDALSAVVKAGRLGRKNGKGFYLYEGGKRRGVDASVYGLLPGRGSRRAPREEIAERMALALCNEAARALGDGVVRSARDADIGAVFGIGFPPFRGGPFRHADAVGPQAVVEALRKQPGTTGADAGSAADDENFFFGFFRRDDFGMPAAPPFLAHGRVLCTADRHIARIACDADVAPNAFADVFHPSFFDLRRQERVGDRRPGRADQIHHAALDRRDHRLRGRVASHTHHGFRGQPLHEREGPLIRGELRAHGVRDRGRHGRAVR